MFRVQIAYICIYIYIRRGIPLISKFNFRRNFLNQFWCFSYCFFLNWQLLLISVDPYARFGAQSPIDQRIFAKCSILRCLGRGRRTNKFASNFFNVYIIVKGLWVSLRSILNIGEMQVPFIVFFNWVLGLEAYRDRSIFARDVAPTQNLISWSKVYLKHTISCFVRVSTLKECGSLKSTILW